VIAWRAEVENPESYKVWENMFETLYVFSQKKLMRVLLKSS